MSLSSVAVLRYVSYPTMVYYTHYKNITQNGEAGHAFVGQETPSKETDCVLIYDEETGVCRVSCFRLLCTYMDLTSNLL